MKEVCKKMSIELQIQELQRKFRVLESDTKAFGEEAQQQIRKQLSLIDKLSKENKKIKDDVKERRGASLAHQNALMGTKNQVLNEQCYILLREYEEEKRREKDLKAKIYLIESRVMKCREKMGPIGGVHAMLISNDSMNKQIRTLENRLNKWLQKYSAAAAQNKALKEEINDLRKERVIFDNLYKKMEKELDDKKKGMAEIVEVANGAYKSRDVAHHQTVNLKVQAVKEHQNFEQEWIQLERMIEIYQRNSKVKHLRNIELQQALQTLHEQEAENNKKERKSWKIKNVDELKSKIQTCDAAFEKIRAATGINDIETLVGCFKSSEVHNFSLFNFVNTVSADIEIVESQICVLRRNINDYYSLKDSAEMRVHLLLNEFEASSFSYEKKAKLLEEKNSILSRRLKWLKKGVFQILMMLNCHRKIKGANWLQQNINESNVTKYLQIIEDEITKIILGAGKKLPASFKEFIMPSGKDISANIKVPSTKEDPVRSKHGENDTGVHPISRKEFREKILAFNSKRIGIRRQRTPAEHQFRK